MLISLGNFARPPRMPHTIFAMRGPYHERLIALLARKIDENDGITQESVARAVGMHQTTLGGVIKRSKGTLDLDEAAAALEHIGSSLPDFIAGHEPRPFTDAERLGRVVDERPGLRRVVELLIAVPKTRLGAVADLIQTVVLPATARSSRETVGSLPSPTKAPRTKPGPKKRRRVQG